MNVLVVFGGESFEHEVSVITGCLVSSLIKEDYNVYPLYINKNKELFYIENCSIENFRNNKLGKKVEFVNKGIKTKLFNYKMDIAIICNHGINGEDGMIKGILDFYNIPSVGSSLISSAVNMDKYYSYCVLKENNINVVDTAFITKDNLSHNIEYPIILKPATLGSSIGIEVCFNEEEYLKKVNESLKYDKKIVVQKYLEDIEEINISLYRNKKGIEISKTELVEKHEEIYSYDDKYNKNILKKRTFINNKLVEELALKAYELFDLSGIVRIDFILHNDVVYLNEINIIPGSLSYYLYDKKFKDVIKELISKELFNKVTQRNITYKSNIIYYDYNMKK
ncbi:MAG: ATP-grasp domain-containing protein [bacterium]